jgi:ubiquinone/menaquinone biosynthesis C-methylase UbiE
MREPDLQPDQQPRRWDEHVSLYEAAFEPLTNQFAAAALRSLSLSPGDRLLDVGAGTGGAALMAEEAGAQVVALDASQAMAARVRARAERVCAVAMDATCLGFADGTFKAALSVFGIILCPDPVAALREMGRVVEPPGRIAVVTWTEPERYELIQRVLAAITAVRGPQPVPAGSPPAQLRHAEEAAFSSLFRDAGLTVEQLERVEASLEAPTARWLGERLAFAPGLASLLAAQGEYRDSVIERFVRDLERDQGQGAITLRAVALVGIGRNAAP